MGLIRIGLGRWLRLATVGMCMMLLPGVWAHVQAQTPGDTALSGTIQDPDGKVVPNAAITVTNESTGAVKNATSGADGRFSAGGLTPGSYTIEVIAPGFAAARRGGLTPGTSGTDELSIALSVEHAHEE